MQDHILSNVLKYGILITHYGLQSDTQDIYVKITCHGKTPSDTLQNCDCLKLRLVQPSEKKTHRRNVLLTNDTLLHQHFFRITIPLDPFTYYLRAIEDYQSTQGQPRNYTNQSASTYYIHGLQSAYGTGICFTIRAQSCHSPTLVSLLSVLQVVAAGLHFRFTSGFFVPFRL
jgi:hypothetical protein